MPAGGLVTATALTVGLGVAKSIKGRSQERKAEAEQKALATSFYRVQNEYQQNKNIAEQQAGQGMPAAQMNYATTENQRGLGASLGTTLQTGGNPNDVTKLFDAYGRTNSQLGAQSAAESAKNIQLLMEANTSLAGQKNMQWAINEKGPTDAKLKELKERMAVGQQNMWGGMSDAVSGISAGVTGWQNQKLLEKKEDLASGLNKKALQIPAGFGNSLGYGETEKDNSNDKDLLFQPAKPTPFATTLNRGADPTQIRPLDNHGFGGAIDYAATPIPNFSNFNWAAPVSN